MSWVIKYFAGIAIAVIFADSVIRNIWLAVTSGVSDGSGSVVRTLGVIGTAIATGGQSASSRRNGWGRWLRKKSSALGNKVDAGESQRK